MWRGWYMRQGNTNLKNVNLNRFMAKIRLQYYLAKMF